MQLEAALALAELYADMGQSAAALKVMDSLQDLGSADYPGTPSAALTLLDRRACLLLRLGQQVGPRHITLAPVAICKRILVPITSGSLCLQLVCRRLLPLMVEMCMNVNGSVGIPEAVDLRTEAGAV